jgi:hypothetical protein
MKDRYVMRRANGDLFVEEANGKVRIPVWPSANAATRYKARNPKLSVYLPTPLNASLLKKINALGAEGTTEFFLLSDDDPDAYFNVGRPIMQEELFSENETTSHNPQSAV